MKKVIITGATSGIGYGLAIEMASRGYIIGAIGRREERLKQLQAQIGEQQCFIMPLDVTDTDQASISYNNLIEQMGGMDIMILNAGVGRDKMLPQWRSDEQIIMVNALAFAHGCHFAFEYFRKQGHGQIVGMSSIASLLASHKASAYTATKHFASNYMTGYRQKVRRIDADITITDIKPGFVESEMTQNNKSMFWVSTTEKAVKQMLNAIERKKKHFYVTKRWNLIAFAAKRVPQWLWDRI